MADIQIEINNSIFDFTKPPNSREELLLYSLINYFNTNKNLNKIIPIIKGESKISLRIIEWFVLIYSKNEQYLFPIFDSNVSPPKLKGLVYVYDSYKNNLKSYHGDCFGIFKRSDIIKLKYGNGENDYIDTTVAQLNFFKWILENEILPFIENNFKKLGKLLFKSNRKGKFKNDVINTKIISTTNNEIDEISINWN